MRRCRSTRRPNDERRAASSISEVRAYRGALGDAERLDVEAELAKRWQL